MRRNSTVSLCPWASLRCWLCLISCHLPVWRHLFMSACLRQSLCFSLSSEILEVIELSLSMNALCWLRIVLSSILSSEPALWLLLSTEWDSGTIPSGNRGNQFCCFRWMKGHSLQIGCAGEHLFLQADDLSFLLHPLCFQSSYSFGLLHLIEVSEICFAVWLGILWAIDFTPGLCPICITVHLISFLGTGWIVFLLMATHNYFIAARFLTVVYYYNILRPNFDGSVNNSAMVQYNEALYNSCIVFELLECLR